MIINPALPPSDENPEDSSDSAPELAEIAEYELESARKIALDLNAAEERWYVMYGAGSRSYWAFPLWDPGLPMVLESASPARLVAAMREAELKHAAKQSAP